MSVIHSILCQGQTEVVLDEKTKMCEYVEEDLSHPVLLADTVLDSVECGAHTSIA